MRGCSIKLPQGTFSSRLKAIDRLLELTFRTQFSNYLYILNNKRNQQSAFTFYTILFESCGDTQRIFVQLPPPWILDVAASLLSCFLNSNANKLNGQWWWDNNFWTNNNFHIQRTNVPAAVCHKSFIIWYVCVCDRPHMTHHFPPSMSFYCRPNCLM